MAFPFHLSAPGRTTKVLLLVALVAVIVAALFDWNWFRRPLELYLTEKSSREVRVADLHVTVGFSLEPIVRLRGVHIENAPWARRQPFATAGEASFTVSLKSLWQGRPVISRLVLVDADVDMERLADGRRNWRLRHPEDRSPGRVRVLTLEAHRTQIGFVNRAIDLDFTATASPLSGDVQRGEDLSTRISYKGAYQGAIFSGEALSGGVISFRDSGFTFPLRGHLMSSRARFDFDGFFTDIFDLGPMDARVRLSGSTLSQLHPFLRIRPPPSRPFDFEAQLTQTHDVWRFAQLKGKIGETDLAGEATYDRSAHRPRVRAELRSEIADIADLGSLVGRRYRSTGPAAKRAAKSAEPQGKAQDDDGMDGDSQRSDKLFSSRPLRIERLRTFDARIVMSAKKLKAQNVSLLDSLRLDGALTDGVLELKPIDLGLAGGHVVGRITFDVRREPPSAQAAIELRGLRLEKLAPSLSATARSVGELRGRVKLAGNGESIAALFASATGSLAARIDNGRISNRADAKLGLNVGKLLSLMVRGDRDIALHCAALAFDLRNGAGKSKTIVLDTEQTRTDGIGSVSLREERWDMLLTPRPKKPGLLTRLASIRVAGSLTRAAVSIEERVALGPGGRSGGSRADNGGLADRPCDAVSVP